MSEGHQSLYRRYRSQRFGELIGQDHVVRALRNAVAQGTEGHAYLFSGPRGTGKTSTARIFAKALNCPNVTAGEPCGTCATCVAIADGTSFDVHELDAASNNGVDAMRDLIERAALGTSGRWKVYILDEVHMLSKGAEAALLKTLEEPPAHVKFVLATTDPQKVSATIRSRCQPFDFHLISAAVLDKHVRYIIADAGLEVSEEAIEAVIRQGAGSARDTLSALDQVAAAGGFTADPLPLDDLIESLIARDPVIALMAVASSADSGRDTRTLADALIAQLREGFLSLQAPNLVRLPDTVAARVADQAKRLGAAAIVRAMEVLGATLVELRHAPDQRVMLEVALVRLTNPELDTSTSALLERIERLERGIPSSSTTQRPPSLEPRTTPDPAHPTSSGPAQARAALGAMKSAPRSAGTDAPPILRVVEGGRPPAAPRNTPAPPHSAEIPVPLTFEVLTTGWNDAVLPTLSGLTRAMFVVGRFVATDQNRAVFALPTAVHRDKCESRRPEVETALALQFGRPVSLSLITQDGPSAQPKSRGQVPVRDAPDERDEQDEGIDTDDLVDAPRQDTNSVERLAAVFGAEVIEEDPT